MEYAVQFAWTRVTRHVNVRSYICACTQAEGGAQTQGRVINMQTYTLTKMLALSLSLPPSLCPSLAVSRSRSLNDQDLVMLLAAARFVSMPMF